MEKPFIIAHRVVNEKIINKNLLKELLFKLQDKNIKGIEFDIRQTKDNEFLAFHDEKFPGIKKSIKDYSLAKLREEAVKNNFSFLTLSEVLEIIPKEFNIHIDLKDAKINIKKFIEEITPFQIFDRLIVSSFYPLTLLKLTDSKIKKRWFLTSISKNRNLLHFIYALTPIRTAIFCKATGIAPFYSLISKKLIEKAHNKNLTVAVWTINDKELIPNFEKIGIDYLVVNPELLI